jgi:DNA-binding transcriptional LysR family regulator
MNWDSLHYFLVFSRTGSLSAASKALGTDHSTVARRIAGLEEELKLRLVDRRARAYSITPAGREICTMASRVEPAIEDIERFARGSAAVPEGPVRVSGPHAIIMHFVTPRCLQLQRQYPNVQLELIGEARELSLSRCETDVALRLTKPSENGLITRKLGVINYGLYGAHSYLAARPPSEWSYVGFDAGRDHLPQQKWLLEIAGQRELALRVNDMAAIIGAVRAGLGVSALPRGMVAGDRSFKEIKTAVPAPARELWLVFHRDVGKAPAIRAVIDHLVAIFKSDWGPSRRPRPASRQ